MVDIARPDLSIEGTIEIERLADVVFVGQVILSDMSQWDGVDRVRLN